MIRKVAKVIILTVVILIVSGCGRYYVLEQAPARKHKAEMRKAEMQNEKLLLAIAIIENQRKLAALKRVQGKWPTKILDPNE